jgi:hypothetical protein
VFGDLLKLSLLTIAAMSALTEASAQPKQNSDQEAAVAIDVAYDAIASAGTVVMAHHVR